jgi:cytochrome P450
VLLKARPNRRREARRIPLHRMVRGLARNPLRTFEEIGRESNGEIVRLNLGMFRAYLVTRPEHAQHVLRDNAANYVRDGMMWNPFRRLVGDGIAGEGPSWEAHRRVFQPLFSGKNVTAFLDHLTDAIAEAVDDLGDRARAGDPVDAGTEMARIVHRAVIRVFFGDRISTADADTLGRAIGTAFASLGARMLLPFVPVSVRLPGDRAFRRAVRTVDEVMYPIVRQARRSAADGNDVVSLLLRARDADGRPFDDRQVRDDLVAMFVAGSESTAVALTWLWVVLARHPDVAARLNDEIDGVVGADPPRPSHLVRLRYTRMVLQELLRLYPVGWILPRTTVAADVVDGVAVRAGSTVIVSPYLTHRLDEFWERPGEFDPERFAPDGRAPGHRFAYLSFGGGPHQCLGTNFFTVEAQLVVATLLSRYRPVLVGPAPIGARAVMTLKPDRPVEMILRPAR